MRLGQAVRATQDPRSARRPREPLHASVAVTTVTTVGHVGPADGALAGAGLPAPPTRVQATPHVRREGERGAETERDEEADAVDEDSACAKQTRLVQRVAEIKPAALRNAIPR